MGKVSKITQLVSGEGMRTQTVSWGWCIYQLESGIFIRKLCDIKQEDGWVGTE